MHLGSFFQSAPSARPICPKPITFTAIATGNVLPGGAPNPHKRSVAATVKAAFVFLDANGVGDSRVQTRTALRERYVDAKTKLPLVTDDQDFARELLYQQLWRIIYEYDEKEQTTGGRLFADPRAMQDLVLIEEANRIMRKYHEYVDEEHPEVVDAETFRSAQG